jgi:hypothetical protein
MIDVCPEMLPCLFSIFLEFPPMMTINPPTVHT